MIKRKHYIEKIRGFYDSDLIKIITGIRRCGKSVVLNQIKEEIEQDGKNVLFLNFEDKRISSKIQNWSDLLNYVEENTDKDKKWYLFFDEIQNIDGWQDAVKTLRLYNYSVFITGSNSKLLANEFTKELSGRYVAFRIYPFVYNEIKEYCNQLGKESSVSDYLNWGGFPKRFEFNSQEEQIQYLNDLDETIVIKDIIARYKIRKEGEFRKLVDYILVSNARIFSSHSIADYMKSNGSRTSENTIKKWLLYLEEAYVISSIPQYSTRTKNILNFYKKIYNADVSFNTIRQNRGRYDLSHNLENIVYNELLYAGFELEVYDNRNKEIDFIAVKNNKTYFIQVAYSLAEDKAYDKEFSAFEGLSIRDKKIIISNDDVDFSTSQINHIGFKDFLENGIE